MTYYEDIGWCSSSLEAEIRVITTKEMCAEACVAEYGAENVHNVE